MPKSPSKPKSQNKKFSDVISRASTNPTEKRETRSSTRSKLATQVVVTRHKKESLKKQKSVISQLAASAETK